MMRVSILSRTLPASLTRQWRCFSSKASSFLLGDSLLDNDQIALREQVKEFAANEIAPIAADVDKHDKFPHDLWPKMGDFGLLGPTVASEYGGLGLGYLDHCIIMEAISRASGSIGLSYVAHSNLCANQMMRWGTDEQKSKYLPKLCDGSFLGALAMSEAGAGSDVVSMKTTAIDKGDHYLLNGSKMWITNGPSADVIIVYAKTNPSAAAKGITAFVVETKLEGFSVAQKLDKLGMRGSETGEIVFQNMKLPTHSVLGDVNRGVAVLMSGLDSERLLLSAGPLGIMQAAYEEALAYVNIRKQFDEYIGDFQLVQGKMADMYTRLIKHRAFVYAVAHAYTRGMAGRIDCAAAVLTSAESGTQMALDALQLLGGNGYINEYPTGRFLRDAKLYEIGGGTSEIRRMLIGRELNSEFRAR